MKINRKSLSAIVLGFSPGLAVAHSPSLNASGWSSGFQHPLNGPDHVLVMIAVGTWAARLGGRKRWLIPMIFIGIMTLGCWAGWDGWDGNTVLPAESMIALSMPVCAVLALCNFRLSSELTILVVGTFAFFHGFVHGQEMPASSGLTSFAFGFSLATLLLHGTGFLVLRFLVLIAAGLFSHEGLADADVESSNDRHEPVQLADIEVKERSDSQLGLADSASQGNIGQKQLKFRPISRPGEVLETVPGLIVSQHSGEGKANQYYLRGFNLDHGTDFLTQIDGVPVNQASHAHGQGWTDTGFLIPELIDTIAYQKGVYYAENGDFSSSGAADIRYIDSLPTSLAKFTGGSFDYYRGLYASSVDLAGGDLLVALEGNYNDGPWLQGNRFAKGNAILGYSRKHDVWGWSATLMGYGAAWNSTDQIPRRAVDSGLLGRFGLIDPTDGGDSRRYSLNAEWHRQDDQSATKVMVYGLYSSLDLFSNFTYFLSDPVRGDQFAQPDRRWQFGLKTSHATYHKLAGADSESIIGLQIRNDSIDNGLLLTQARQYIGTVRQDRIRQISISPYFDNKTQWNNWLRTQIGLRLDGYRFQTDSNRPDNSGEGFDGIVSPKASLVLGPWQKTELYVNGGLGFHSNDARGINTHVDPGSGKPFDADGNPVRPADPLVRTYGAEIGLRNNWLDGLQSTWALWWLDIDSELVFVGDAGTTETGRPSRRYGLEWTNYYEPTDWLTLDADFSFSHARFRDNPMVPNTGLPIGNRIPGSVETVIAAGATVHDSLGWFGSLRLRYFGPRALIEDNSQRSEPTLLLSANLGYEITQNLSVQAEVFNLLNRKDSAIDYFYTSRFPGEPSQGVNDVHFHPVEPIGLRIGLTARF